jgi:hypothetical protein
VPIGTPLHMKFLVKYQSVVGDLKWDPTSVLIYIEGSGTTGKDTLLLPRTT